MDSSPEKKSNDLPIPALVSLLFAALAILVQQFIPLESPRPKTASSGHYLYPSIQDVNARLWQDPFTTLTQHDASLDNTGPCQSRSPHDVLALACSLIAAHKKSGDKAITVLGVMVFGGPYAEDIEFRMRTRYAVVSGLAVKNYFPEDEQHIGYFEKTMNSKFLPEKIPFEWFKAKVGSPVLLLWLDETVFRTEPLKRARQLVELLEYETNAASYFKTDSLELNFKFIGPASSTTLQAMVDELDAASKIPGADPDQQAKPVQNGDNESNLIGYLKSQPFEFYDASATGDSPSLTFPDDNKDTTLQSYLNNQGLASLLTRTSLTDNQLASAMTDELKLRGFKINSECEKKQDFESCRNNKDHIALISEWDTRYGRSLPEVMKKALAPWLDDCIEQKKSEKECSPKWLHPFSYMRGLDGVVPGEGKTAEEGKANKENDKNKKTKPGPERPEGQNQKDYLRRLAMQISDMERDLKNKGEDIRAIGVLGSDAYDKLMILQALKPIFPKAVFFTTDLDTRLNYSEDFEVTRNLLVSASFGLQLGSDFQRAIPPFRDSYQTAFFLATQIALDSADEKKVSQIEINEKLGGARLFETGFSKAIPLGAGNCSLTQDCNSYHPTKKYSAWPNWKRIAAGSFTLVFIILLANILSERCRKFLGKTKRFIRYCIVFDLCMFWPNPVPARMRRRIWTLARMLLFPQVLMLIVLGVTGYEISLGDQGEFFYWNEGVSIWPTELIRLFAGILGCLFIASTAKAVERNKKQLSKRFFCYDKHAENLADYGEEQRQEEDDGLQKKDGKSFVNVSILWRWYCVKTSPSLRNRRVFWTSLISVLVGFSLLFISGFPNTPYRGEASRLANMLALLFCVPVFLVLVMMVVDATWRSVDLINRLARAISIWPDETLGKFGLKQDFSRQRTIDGNALDKLRNELRIQGKYHLDEWIDIQFIAVHTKAVGKLVYYPFIILVLMIFARSNIFDNWDMPIGLVLIFLLSGGLTLACALYLRRAAERTRQAVYRQIDEMLIELSSRPEEAARILEKQVRIALNQIQKLNEGAFLPISQEPAVQALLLPFGGWGGVTLLEYFVSKGF